MPRKQSDRLDCARPNSHSDVEKLIVENNFVSSDRRVWEIEVFGVPICILVGLRTY